MSITDINREYYNKLYKSRYSIISIIHSYISFDQQSKSKNNYAIIKDYIGDRMNATLNILDYGFGHGTLLLKYKNHHHLFGSDISEEAVFNFRKIAHLLGKNIKALTVDNFFQECSTVKFDIISLSHIIEHVPDDFDLVKKLSGKLSTNGIILINVPINEVWKDPKHIREYNINYLTSLLAKCGLKIINKSELDKLTSFFLIQEKVKSANAFNIFSIKFLRLFSAMLPVNWIKIIEDMFLYKHKCQQLLVLAIKE